MERVLLQRSNENLGTFNGVVLRYIAGIKERGLGFYTQKVPKNEEDFFRQLKNFNYHLDNFEEIKAKINFEEIKTIYHNKITESERYFRKDTLIESAVVSAMEETILEHKMLKRLFVEDDSNLKTFDVVGSTFDFCWKLQGVDGGPPNWEHLTDRNKWRLDISSRDKFYDSLVILGLGTKITDCMSYPRELAEIIVPYERFLMAYQLDYKSYNNRLKILRAIIENMIQEHGNFKRVVDGVESEYRMEVYRFVVEQRKDTADPDGWFSFWSGFEVRLLSLENNTLNSALTIKEKMELFDYDEVYRRLNLYFKENGLINEPMKEYFDGPGKELSLEHLEGLINDDTPFDALREAKTEFTETEETNTETQSN